MIESVRNAPLLAITGGLLLSVLFVSAAQAQAGRTYDIVLQNGRVIDPDTGLDAIRHVGIDGDRIAEISVNPLTGRRVVDVTGLVVAPGFIDLHVHGQTNNANEFQAHDGVTTALELERGKAMLSEWLAWRSGNAMINFGAAVDWTAARWIAMDKYSREVDETLRLVRAEGAGGPRYSEFASGGLQVSLGAQYVSLTPDETALMLDNLDGELQAGGIAIGLPVGYFPGATAGEIFDVYQYAAAKDSIIFSHVREPNFLAVQEAIANATVTGAALHIVHLNSVTLAQIDVALDMIATARDNGFDISTELYPYTAASTRLESAMFDPGWQDRLGISYDALQWVGDSERLTEALFNRYREEGGTVIIHIMQPEWIEAGIRSPFTMIASDGMPYEPGAHPRSAGTFSRVLGRYVREQETISLVEALGKMTIMPARRLEEVAPMMRFKGRIQVGADADITVFDPDKIIDTATFEKDLSFSVGVHHVLVNGTFVVKDGNTVDGALPGRAVIGKYRR